MQIKTIRKLQLGLSNALITVCLLLFIACSPTEDQTSTAVPEQAAPEVAKQTDIPMTSSSSAAKALYADGQYLLDVGRGVQAREKFRAASNDGLVVIWNARV